MAFDLDEALRETVRLGGSDLHLKVPAVPHVRVEGNLIPLEGIGSVRPEDTARPQGPFPAVRDQA